MSFAFPTVDPETSGQVRDMEVPLSRYLDASYSWGQHDNVLNSLSRVAEINAADADPTSPLLSPEEASKKWGVGNLKFDKPIRESTARILNKRKRDEMDRQFFLSEGHTAGRFIPGFAAGMLGAISNPIDLGLMFVPFVGEEKLAAKMTTVGGKMLARRLVTREFLQQAVPLAPHLTESVINGVLGQSLFEIPNLIASHQDKADYGPSQALLNVGLGGAFAATLQQLGRLVSRMGRGTREEMMRTALNQVLRDEAINVHHFVKLDEQALWHAAQFDEVAAREVAAKAVDLETIKKKLVDSNGMRMNPDTPAAYISQEGDIWVGAAHWTLEGQRFVEEHNGAIRGYHLADGRVVAESQVASEIGIPAADLTSEFFVFSNENALTVNEEAHFQELQDSGMSRNESLSEVFADRERRIQDNFFKNPENKEKLIKQVDNNVQAEVERMRQEHDAFGKFGELRQKEIDRQIAEGRTMTPEEIQRHTPVEKFEDMAEGDVTEEIATLKKELGLDEKAPEGEGKAPKAEEKGTLDTLISKVDEMISKIENSSKDKLFTGITGLEPLIAMVGKEVAKGLLIAVREGLKLTKDLTKAIDHAMEWFSKNQPKQEWFHATSNVDSMMSSNLQKLTGKDGFQPVRKGHGGMWLTSDKQVHEDMKLFNDEAADFDTATTEMVDISKKNLVEVDLKESEPRAEWNFNESDSPESLKAVAQGNAIDKKISDAIDQAFEEGYDGVMFRNMNQMEVFNSGRKIHDQAFVFALTNPDKKAPSQIRAHLESAIKAEAKLQSTKQFGLSDADLADIRSGDATIQDVIDRNLAPFDNEGGGGPDHGKALQQAREEARMQIEMELAKVEPKTESIEAAVDCILKQII